MQYIKSITYFESAHSIISLLQALLSEFYRGPIQYLQLNERSTFSPVPLKCLHSHILLPPSGPIRQ
jgi:hypothetical protein